MTLGRRDAFAVLGALVAAACARSAPPLVRPAADSGPSPRLRLDPLVGVVPAAGLVWLVEARTRELLADPGLIPAVALVVSESRFDALAARHGGVDVREATDFVLASFPDALLALARLPLDPGRVESAFGKRAASIDGRASDHGVTRLWGNVGAAREQVAIFGREAVGLEHGRLGPLRAAVYFAEGRLARASPALEAAPLAEAAQKLGSAPFRAFAPGPFEGALANGFGGLLQASTSVALGVWPGERPTIPGAPDHAAALRLRVLLTGGWGDDGPAAAQRLKAASGVLAADPLGRLCGVDHPIEPPATSVVGGALRLDVTLDALALARGLRDVTTATVSDLMAY